MKFIGGECFCIWVQNSQLHQHGVERCGGEAFPTEGAEGCVRVSIRGHGVMCHLSTFGTEGGVVAGVGRARWRLR